MKNKFVCTCSLCGKLVAIGEGDTNMVNGKWKTQHANVPCPATQQGNFGSPASHGYPGDFDDDDDFYWHDGTSEDVNPNEGCK